MRALTDQRGTNAAAPGAAISDEDVVRRVLDGDTGAFELLMRRHNQRLYRVVRGVLGGARGGAEAEDVLQEAYLRAYEHLADFRGESKFSTWLTKIAVHEASARRRRGARWRTGPDGALEAAVMDAPHGHESGEAAASRREVRELLTAAADGLPPALRVILVLRDVERLDTAETAACLGLSEANVKVRLHRARALMRERLERELGAEICRLYAFDGDRCDRVVRGVLRRIGGAAAGAR